MREGTRWKLQSLYKPDLEMTSYHFCYTQLSENQHVQPTLKGCEPREHEDQDTELVLRGPFQAVCQTLFGSFQGYLEGIWQKHKKKGSYRDSASRCFAPKPPSYKQKKERE